LKKRLFSQRFYNSGQSKFSSSKFNAEPHEPTLACSFISGLAKMRSVKNESLMLMVFPSEIYQIKVKLVFSWILLQSASLSNTNQQSCLEVFILWMSKWFNQWLFYPRKTRFSQQCSPRSIRRSCDLLRQLKLKHLHKLQEQRNQTCLINWF
jgi:hypothetical protein